MQARYLISFVLILTSCTAAQIPTEGPTTTMSPTMVEAQKPPTSTPTITPTRTPTPLPAVLSGTSVSIPTAAISIDNISHVHQLAKWESGEQSIPVDSLAFSPDNTWLLSGLDDGNIQVWRVSNGSLEHTLVGDGIHATSIAFSPDGTRLAVGSWPFSVKLWSWTLEGLGTQIRSITNDADGPPVAFSPDGKWLVTMYPGNLGYRNGSDGAKERFWASSLLGDSTTFAFSPDGAIIAVGTNGGKVHLVQVSDQKVLDTLVGNPSKIDSLVFSSDGTKIAAGFFDGSIKVWSMPGGMLELSLDAIGPNPQCYSCYVPVSFSPDSTLLAGGSVDERIRIWRVSDGTLMQTLTGHTKAIRSLTFSSDGIFLSSGSDDGTVRLWGVGP